MVSTINHRLLLVREAHRLGAQARPLTPALAPLLRAMNSYYTNKIEGQHTRPYDIERALVKDFDADKAQAAKQRLALAHIDAKVELEVATRASSLLPWLAAHPWDIGVERSGIKLETLEALHYVALTGSLERARFLAMTGLPPRTARRVL